jgi:hypothetical protein
MFADLKLCSVFVNFISSSGEILVINERLMNNPFSSGSTTEIGLCSSVGFYNPMFIGKVTITDNTNPNTILDA